MSVVGTKPTSKPVRRMSAIRGKPDVTQAFLDDWILPDSDIGPKGGRSAFGYPPV